jgi:uncharacterized protein (DUF4415 family)
LEVDRLTDLIESLFCFRQRWEESPGLADHQGHVVFVRRLDHASPTLKRRSHHLLDEDVFAWFRTHGPGYQTRINAVLRAYVEARRREAK